MEQLTRLYRINDTNLKLRKQFLRFAEEDIHILKRLTGWAERVADAIAKEFYDHQFGFSETRAFFENFARMKGIPIE
ncbi:MAG: protoglobin domain-containing protein, partial [Armatimonadota bacterium]|nr:protoglobin domain-containing protein [Armatimonadota bacterium]